MDKTTQFVMLNVYNSVHQDPDTNLWWVSAETAINLMITPIKILSTPLVIAHLEKGDDKRTWFLSP